MSWNNDGSTCEKKQDSCQGEQVCQSPLNIDLMELYFVHFVSPAINICILESGYNDYSVHYNIYFASC